MAATSNTQGTQQFLSRLGWSDAEVAKILAGPDKSSIFDLANAKVEADTLPTADAATVPTAPATPATAPAPQPNPATDGPVWSTDLEALLIALDQSQPGTAASYRLIKAQLQQNPTAVTNAIKRFKTVYGNWLSAQAQAGTLRSDRLAQAQGDLTALQVGDQITSGVQAVPIVGQILGGVWKIARMFVQLDAEAKAGGYNVWASNWVAGGAPIFSGFRDGDFYFYDVPVLSLTSPIWVANFPQNPPDVWDAQLQAFVALCSVRPFGYDVSPVTIVSDAGYSYVFDQGSRGVEVWNPLDITPTGPRGFDPAHPFSWRVNGAKRSIFDPPPAS